MLITNKSTLTNLSVNSHYKVELKCDYCDITFNREYRRYLEVKSNCNTNKDHCKKCIKYKNIEEFLISIKSNQFDLLFNYMIPNNKQSLCGVYAIIDKKSNKSYIGSSKDIFHRWRSHLYEINSKTHYCKEFNELTLDDLEFVVLFISEDNDDFVSLEFKYIELFNTTDSEFGYNIMGKTRNKKKVSTGVNKGIDLDRRLKNSIFTIDEIKDIKTSLYNGKRILDISKEYNVQPSTIWSIKGCETWADILPELNDTLINIKYEKIREGESNSSSKLKEKQVLEIKKLLKEGNLSMTSIGKQYGVSRTLISYIRNGKLWSHVS